MKSKTGMKRIGMAGPVSVEKESCAFESSTFTAELCSRQTKRFLDGQLVNDVSSQRLAVHQYGAIAGLNGLLQMKGATLR